MNYKLGNLYGTELGPLNVGDSYVAWFIVWALAVEGRKVKIVVEIIGIEIQLDMSNKLKWSTYS